MADYYNALTAIDYKVFLEHFKHQASGKHRITTLPNYLSRGAFGKMGSQSFVIVDKPRPETSTVRGDHMPKIEVYDENEASKRRAESELEREQAISLGAVQKTNQSSSSAPSGMSVSVAQKRKANQEVKLKVKRAKDLFDI